MEVESNGERRESKFAGVSVAYYFLAVIYSWSQWYSKLNNNIKNTKKKWNCNVRNSYISTAISVLIMQQDQYVKEDNAAIQTRRAFFHQLKEVISKSDVIMIVLDARDPMVATLSYFVNRRDVEAS